MFTAYFNFVIIILDPGVFNPSVSDSCIMKSTPSVAPRSSIGVTWELVRTAGLQARPAPAQSKSPFPSGPQVIPGPLQPGTAASAECVLRAARAKREQLRRSRPGGRRAQGRVVASGSSAGQLRARWSRREQGREGRGRSRSSRPSELVGLVFLKKGGGQFDF